MGDFIISVFSLHNLTDIKSSTLVDVRLVGEFGRAQQTPKIKGNPNPVFNVNYRFRVRKQDIKVRFEVIKPGTFSDTSLGVVEVATGALIPGIASDVWLQLGTTGIQLHVAILFVPDAQFQRDLIIQKATQRTQSGDLGTVISTGGSAILADVNRSIDPIGAPQPQVILVQQPPPTQPQLYTTAPIATQPPVMYVSQPSATQLQLHPQQQPPPQYPQGLYPAPQPYLQQPSQPMYAMPQQQQQQQAGAYVAPANLQQ